MPRKKFEPKDWHSEIERWEKEINDSWRGYKQKEKEEEEKRALTEPDYCPHPKTGWFNHEYIYFECGEVLKTNYIMKNYDGYGFRNHIQWSGGRKK